jgi:hypothetical protein
MNTNPHDRSPDAVAFLSPFREMRQFRPIPFPLTTQFIPTLFIGAPMREVLEPGTISHLIEIGAATFAGRFSLRLIAIPCFVKAIGPVCFDRATSRSTRYV